MVTKPSTEQTQDFSIHNEDFPALPGPNYKDTTLNNDDSKTVRATDGPTGHLCICIKGINQKESTFWNHTFLSVKIIIIFVVIVVVFTFRTWTPQARAHPAQMGQSSLETRQHQHRTTTRRKGSRCCQMVRPHSQSYRSNSSETSLHNRTAWVRLLGSLPCIWSLIHIG